MFVVEEKGVDKFDEESQTNLLQKFVKYIKV